MKPHQPDCEWPFGPCTCEAGWPACTDVRSEQDDLVHPFVD